MKSKISLEEELMEWEEKFSKLSLHNNYSEFVCVFNHIQRLKFQFYKVNSSPEFVDGVDGMELEVFRLKVVELYYLLIHLMREKSFNYSLGRQSDVIEVEEEIRAVYKELKRVFEKYRLPPQ